MTVQIKEKQMFVALASQVGTLHSPRCMSNLLSCDVVKSQGAKVRVFLAGWLTCNSVTGTIHLSTVITEDG
ncbi:hypothetical protein SFRURICE_017537 [Spodoptera frugiperda]|nr:hypothetical protein SFRURICE_017537 [Spodoptera frugiperda]